MTQAREWIHTLVSRIERLHRPYVVLLRISNFVCVVNTGPLSLCPQLPATARMKFKYGSQFSYLAYIRPPDSSVPIPQVARTPQPLVLTVAMIAIASTVPRAAQPGATAGEGFPVPKSLREPVMKVRKPVFSLCTWFQFSCLA